jgi:general secretion pathway protein D
LLALAFVLQACSAATNPSDLLEQKATSVPGGTPSAEIKQHKLERYLANTDTTFQGFEQVGSGRLTGEPIAYAQEGSGAEMEDVTLNLVGASIPQAAKSIMGDILEVDYSVDARVAGNITIQTSQPISRARLLQLFESALRDSNAAIVANSGTYRIVPLELAGRSTASIETSEGDSGAPGIRPQLVALRFVSADNMRSVLEPMIPAGMLVKADMDRNALVLSGTEREVAAIRETISVFDVDWMRGMSFALIPVKTSSPAAIVQDLDQVFNTSSGPLKGVVRFVPNNRLKSVLVISSRPKYMKEATRWIRKIDMLADSSESSLHVYHVQNRNAAELAKILSSALSASGGGGATADGQVAPGLVAKTVAVPGDGLQPPGDGSLTGGPETPASGIDVLPGPAQSPVQTISPQLRVVADDANNALLIYCTESEFDRIKPILFDIDTVPNQVLLEAVIAEVSLDDDLKFGVRWFLGEKNNGGTFSDAVSGAVSSVFPGFSYFLKANNISFALNALSSVTNVNVLSAPSIVVLDNKTATLQVGDQVPIVTQSAKSTNSKDAPIVSNVELKDTGVILNVTPRVNDSGIVTLDIEQEVSSVVRTTTSGIDSPTIRQRKMKTSVVVSDSEALALGGLIQEKENTTKTKVPVLGDVPVLGAAFRQKQNDVSRTELIIFIRPRVIRDMDEARQVTEEFRRQLSIQAPKVSREDPTPGDQLIRIIN